ncbi:hypothetical protein DS891_01445 [Pseudoalteromonas sp. JC28]|uniref:hypothetical protein n=1 Tax=Pseudoalteromonas sp. JC28 TaxID=2267617 RepID=UPI001573B30D|nr:hypothetical protein [Pseudoalteromonas sp. JC28]NSY32273.1 hypothetical protein [Pseudoalteromonas sp. JC28]
MILDEFNELDINTSSVGKPTHIVFQKIAIEEGQIDYLAMGYAQQDGLPHHRTEGELAGIEFVIVPMASAANYGYRPRESWLEEPEPTFH